jgi:N-acetylglucosamine malate deacetylase 1
VRVLVVSAHADDGEDALGGTIVRLLEESNDVHYLALSICEESVPPPFPRDILYTECLASTKALGIPKDNVTIRRFAVRRFPEHRQEILDELILHRNRLEPEVVFAPSTADVHQDHTTVSAEVIRAFRRSASIYGYDFPWNVLYTAQLNVFYELADRHLRKKVEALQHYKSQLSKENNCLTEEYVRSLAVERGNRVGVRYAEAFEAIREVRRVGR